jgi:hypothetical protein
LNRHEHRRASKKRFAVRIEIITGEHLPARIGRNGALAATIMRVVEAMNTDRPPMCAGCRDLLTTSEPPAAFALFKRLDNGTLTLGGICTPCSFRERTDLLHRVAAIAGVKIATVRPGGHA